jgi:hypothetical protein
MGSMGSTGSMGSMGLLGACSDDASCATMAWLLIGCCRVEDGESKKKRSCSTSS